MKPYLRDIALNLDRRDSENDCKSDGPALSWFAVEEVVELLQAANEKYITPLIHTTSSDP